jgi:hypothetical protein
MNNESEFFTGISKHSKTMYENKRVKRVFSYIVLECLDIPVSRGAPDSAFSYPTGYRICRIFEKYPAGYLKYPAGYRIVQLSHYPARISGRI